MLTKKQINSLNKIFKAYPKIKLVYLFGSRANAKIGPLSDYDFAVYLDEKDKNKRGELKMELIGRIMMILKTNEIDLCILNDIDSPEFKYRIINEGILIFEREPFKLLVEPYILNEFFDFRYSLKKYKLTKAYE